MNYASMSGKHFDHCEYKSAFTLWPIKEELKVVIEAPQLAALKSFRVPVNLTADKFFATLSANYFIQRIST